MKTAAAPISTLTPPPTAVPAGPQPHHAPPAVSSPFEVDDDTAIPPLPPDLVPDLIHPAAMTRDALAKVEAKLAKVQQDLDAASAEQGRLIRARRVLSDTLSAFQAVIAQ